jgi:hypothetical protein
MKKDAYYFPHFCNARNDNKILKLRRILGLDGYAIYFMLLEVLREQTAFRYPLSGLDELAFEFRASKEVIGSIVTNFELFEIDDDDFFSPKQIQYLMPYIEKSEKMRLNAQKRWENANAMQLHNKRNAKALQPQSKSNASKVKESKGKESKVKESKVNETLVERMRTAFDSLSIEKYKMVFRDLNIEDELQEFRLKVDGESKYESYTVGELRTAFQYHLKTSKSKTNKHGKRIDPKNELGDIYSRNK